MSIRSDWSGAYTSRFQRRHLIGLSRETSRALAPFLVAHRHDGGARPLLGLGRVLVRRVVASAPRRAL